VRALVPLFPLLATLLAAPHAQRLAAVEIGAAERSYEAARYWRDQLELLDARGAKRSEEGFERTELEQRAAESREALRTALAAPDATTARDPEEKLALEVMREALAGPLAAPAFGSSGSPASNTEKSRDCSGDLVAQAGGGDEPAPLSALLYRCYGAAAMAIAFEGETTDRLSILERLRGEPDRARRRKLFESLLILGRIVNGDGGVDGGRSPYRELVRRTAIVWKRDGSPIDRQLVTLGLDPGAFEAALVRFLESWRALQPQGADQRIEPWDLHYSTAEASRNFAATVSPERLESIARRFYADLGADPAALGVRLDLAPRPGKTPVAFSNFGERRQIENGVVKPTVPWIFATYRAGGFDNLVELMHELGHAVHIAAIDTRPAFLDWPDLDSFSEALGDLVAMDAYEPAWQERYLGRSVPLAAALRSKYGAIALDIAWALFEIRIHRDPARAPNELWSELAERYLGVAPHPDWSWWMLRGQLVSNPGYMANYAIGAVIAADLRQRAKELHGPFLDGDAGWYGRLSASLYRFGRERSSRAVIEAFLGRPLTTEALLADLGRGREAAVAAGSAPGVGAQ
jgi:hypothetical protein